MGDQMGARRAASGRRCYLDVNFQEERTDWIERILGISPDGGAGTTEALFVVAAIAIAGLMIAATPRFRPYARRVLTRRA